MKCINLNLSAVTFLLGDLLFQQFSFLPGLYWVIAVIPLMILCFFKNATRLLSGFLLGFIWAFFYTHHLTAWILPKEMEGQPMLVTGYVASIPNYSAEGVSFLFLTPSAMIKLSNNDLKFMIHSGEKWQFRVKLKNIHGTFNPGGFDYEGWALQNGVRASGYIVKSNENKFLSGEGYHFILTRIREY